MDRTISRTISLDEWVSLSLLLEEERNIQRSRCLYEEEERTTKFSAEAASASDVAAGGGRLEGNCLGSRNHHEEELHHCANVVEGVCRVALLLVNRLLLLQNNGAAAVRASDIAMENFVVEIVVPAENDAAEAPSELQPLPPVAVARHLSTATDDEFREMIARSVRHFKRWHQQPKMTFGPHQHKLDDERVASACWGSDDVRLIVEGVTSVNIIPASLRRCNVNGDGDSYGECRDNGSLEQQVNTNNALLNKLGLLFYELFARGKSTSPLRSDPEEATGKAATAVGNDYDGGEEETSDTEKGRRKGGGGGLRRKSRRNEIRLIVVDSLRRSGVPRAISTFVSDLIRSNSFREFLPDDAFASLEDVKVELLHFIEHPNKFLHDDEKAIDRQFKNGRQSLEFGDNIYGRHEEMECLLRVAAEVQLDHGSPNSSIVLISGHSGSGKSCLVQNLQVPFIEMGWFVLNCKFDRIARHKPLAAIASAFDAFIASIVAMRRGNASARVGIPDEITYSDAIVASIDRHLTAAGVVALQELIPSLASLFPHARSKIVGYDSDDEEDSSNDDSNPINLVEMTTNVDNSKNRLNYLFRMLVLAISNPEHSVLFFADDLQWADAASLDLLSSLTLDFDHLQSFGRAEDRRRGFLLVGSFRDNEIDEGHILAPFLKNVDESKEARVTNIYIDGVDRTSINVMISHALCLPLRLTRSLTGAVYRKTLGNPLFVRTFVQTLVEEKLLSFSLVEKRWIWETEAIESEPVDNNVAELLTQKLLRMPSEIQQTLKVVSCFGSQVDERAMRLLTSLDTNNYCSSSLSFAAGEGILDKSGSVYTFAHDAVQQAAYELLSPEERSYMHYSIGVQLVKGITPDASGSEMGSFLFLAVDQINRVQYPVIIDPNLHIVFATLNLRAAEEALEVADFSSALSYVEFGIPFLGDTSWELNYDLTLRLISAAGVAYYAHGLTDKVKMHLEDVFVNAQCFEDKLTSYLLMIKTLAASHQMAHAVDKIFYLLKELGEDFPPEVDPSSIRAEMLRTKESIDDLSIEDILASPRMQDKKKMWAAKLMDAAINYLYITNAMRLPLVACRLIKLSLEYGYCKDSATGYSIFAFSLIAIFRNISDAYKWGKTALAILENFGANESYPKVKLQVTHFVTVWVEPLQATSSQLQDLYKDALMVGDLESASLSALCGCIQKLISGRALSPLNQEAKFYAMKMAQLKHLHIFYLHASHFNLVLKLTGSMENPFLLIEGDIRNEDDFLNVSSKKGILNSVQFITFNRMFAEFWIGSYDEASVLAEKYRVRNTLRFTDIYHIFVEGLIAFHFARRSEETKKWTDIGMNAISIMSVWSEHSSWNFVNKLHLLEAERHFWNGDDSKALECYDKSIRAAKNHHFVHEEGLAYEKVALFHHDRGRKNDALECCVNAKKCYEAWGAVAVAERIQGFILTLLSQ